MEYPIIQNVGLEKAILASCFCSDSALHEMATRLDPSDFTIGTYSKIAGELKKCSAKGYSPEASLMAEKVGEEFYVAYAEFMSTGTSDDIQNHCKKLREATQARGIVDKAYKILMNAYGAKDHADFSRRAMAEMMSVSLDFNGAKLEHISKFIGSAVEQWQENANPNKSSGVKSGLADVDKETGGFRKGEYIIIAGRPGEGKTSVALSMAKNIGLEKQNVGIFSLEMTIEELVFKLSSMVSNVPLAVFRGTSEGGQDHFNRGAVGMGRLRDESNIFISDSATVSMTDIEVELRRFVKMNGLDIVFIDYIGLINEENYSHRKRHEQIQEFSMRLKRIAKELRIPVVVLVQLNRDAANKRPNMSQLAESSQLERDADLIYLLWQPFKDEPTQRILICDKARNSAKGDIPFYFDTSTTECSNMSHEGAIQMIKRLSNSEQKQEKEILSF